jgi:hypothetical protein
MPQTADKVLDHEMLFREPEYQKLFADKKANFEFNHATPRSRRSATGPRARNTRTRTSPAKR